MVDELVQIIGPLCISSNMNLDNPIIRPLSLTRIGQKVDVFFPASSYP